MPSVVLIIICVSGTYGGSYATVSTTVMKSMEACQKAEAFVNAPTLCKTTCILDADASKKKGGK